ncbi:unnamed protein product [Rodentolepis nana]|uniref:Type VI secretion system secreted protein VgrG n=1 Tax=Rodentolepis nana TaxID=102285 RepID=A0A0R3TTB9_RODNA|nr:unnamed protein product [Rodentolepis nana]
MTIKKTKLIVEQFDDLDSTATRSRKPITRNSIPLLPKIIGLTTSQQSITIGGQSKESIWKDCQIDTAAITDGVFAIIKRNLKSGYEIIHKGVSEIYVDYEKINTSTALNDGQIACFEFPSEATLKPRVSKYRITRGVENSDGRQQYSLFQLKKTNETKKP